MPILPGIERVRGKYDAVFAVGFPYTVFSFAAWKTARASNAPLILTPFLHLATPGDPVNRAYTKPHQIRLLREADCVVVQTVGEFEAVRGWGIPAEKILKLGMGVDVEAVTGGDRSRFRSELGIAGNSWVVGHLATLDPNKGTIDLIRSVSILNRDRSASESVQLILAGPSSPCFERFLRDEPELASRPWLKRLGPLPSEDRADFFAAIDAFAMPSRTDSFGIVFLEAWANGLPVVAAAAGGVVEVVDDGSTGYLVPFGDSNALADRIGRLLNDPELSRRLGDAGRVRIANGFSWDDRFGTLLERTNRLISERSAALHARIA